ncbi:MAG: DUF6460 domain-containing protein [Rhizobiaceae bacterium]|nr:DUF6460 domain-containing protein [Rhizobiaceae bacterium]
MSAFARMLGDSPLRVAVKLLIASLLVGIVLAALDWTPRDVYARVIDLFVSLWEAGFEALGRFGEYVLLGAAIVIPVFIVVRLLSVRRN